MICGDSPVWGETVAAAEVAGRGSPSAEGPSPICMAAASSSRMSAQMESEVRGSCVCVKDPSVSLMMRVE